MKLIGRAAAVSVAVVAIVLGGSLSPASASFTSASGYLVCPAGQRLHVNVELDNAATIQFRLGGSVKYTSPSTYLGYTYDYGVRGGSWRVDSGGGIRTVSDYCSGAVLL